MFCFFKFLFFSEHKAAYRSIACEHKTTSFRVYRLAHGKKAKCNKDYKVLKSLKKLDIIEGVLQLD